jgi:hypothetical protein
MSKDLTQENAYIFRIVHKDNVAPILLGECRCRSDLNDGACYVEIGNQELIQKRTTRVVDCEPGGTLSDYVPFYFTPFTPMMYNIITGYGVPKRPAADILILVSSLHHLVKQGITFAFSDRHAYLKAARFSNNLADLSWIIWPTLQKRDFKKDDVDKFEKYQAEALSHRHVPVNALLGIACYNDSVRAAVQAEANKNGVALKVSAQPKWYL